MHEPFETLTARTRDMHRALVSLQEELEAVDWYQQRVDVCEDVALRKILEHNRDEEKEHAAMVMEWLRRNDVAFAKVFERYLFTRGDLTKMEEQEEAASAGQGAA